MRTKNRGLFGSPCAALIIFVFLLAPFTVWGAPEEPSVAPEFLESIGMPKDSDVPQSFEIPEDIEIPEDWSLDFEASDTLKETISSADLKAMWDPGFSGFCYMLPNETWFLINVPAGAVSVRTVTIDLSENLYLMHVERDGKFLDFSSGLTFSEEGDYQLMLQTAKLEHEKTPVIYQIPLRFTICRENTNRIHAIEVPPGFYVGSASLDGKEQSFDDALIVPDEDGRWKFNFVSRYDGRAVYGLELNLDRQAPELLFSKPIDQGFVSPPLMITASEEDCEILVQKGAEIVPLTTGVLKSGGSYRVISRDSKGNERSYSVQMRYTAFRFDKKWMLLIIISAAGLIGYLFYLRRHTKI